MKITDLFITTTANASTEDLERWRDICNAIMTLTHNEPVFNPFNDNLQSAIDGLDIDIAGSRREDRIAEENAKYREDMPNA